MRKDLISGQGKSLLRNFSNLKFFGKLGV
jgi:hypothetical protein